MKKKKVLKSMARFKVIVRETLLNNLPPIVLFDLYELSEDQINYLYQRLNEVYDIDTNKDEELDSFYIPEKDRRLTGYNLNFLFQKLAAAKESKLDQEYENIREEIIALNINLVKNSIKFLFKDIHLPKADAMMFGVEGLLDAIDSYQGKSQATFYAYAISQIVLNIQNHFKELVGVTYEEYKQGANNLDIPASIMIIEEPSNTTGDQMNQEDEQMDPEEEPINPEDNQMPISFEDYEEVDALEDEELSDYGTEEINYDNYDNKELRTILEQRLANIRPFESKIIRLYFGFDGDEPMNFSQIARIVKKSSTTVSNNFYHGLNILKNQSGYHEELRAYAHCLPKGICERYEEEIQITANAYIRIYDLLVHEISAEAFPNFMKMAGYVMSPKEIVDVANNIKKLYGTCEHCDFDHSTVCSVLKDHFSSDISNNNWIKVCIKVTKFICQNPNIHFQLRFRNFDDNRYKMYKREPLKPEQLNNLIKTAKRMK